ITYHLYKVNRLTQHTSVICKTDNAPTNNSQSIDHRRVLVSTHHTVRIIKTVFLPDAFSQILEIHLMTDSNAGRNYAKAVERLHAPLQELITRVVTAKLHFHVLTERVAAAREVDLHRMIYNQVDRHQRFDNSRILVQTRYCRAHRSQIDQQGHASEVLKQDA